MTDEDATRRGRGALAGARVAFGVVWLAVIGLHLSWRNWDEAAFWTAIAVVTMTASWAGRPGFCQRR